MIEIEVLDHVIIGYDRNYGFKHIEYYISEGLISSHIIFYLLYDLYDFLELYVQ